MTIQNSQDSEGRAPGLQVDGSATDEKTYEIYDNHHPEINGGGATDEYSTSLHPLAKQFRISDFHMQFVDAVLSDPYRNFTQAFLLLRPNCTYEAAKTTASRLMRDPNIHAYMQHCLDNNHKAAVATREFVLLRLRHVVDRAMGAEPVMDKEGQPTGEYQCDFKAANKALELLGKHHGLFTEDSRLRIKHNRPLVKITVAGTPDTSTPVKVENQEG